MGGVLHPQDHFALARWRRYQSGGGAMKHLQQRLDYQKRDWMEVGECRPGLRPNGGEGVQLSWVLSSSSQIVREPRLSSARAWSKKLIARHRCFSDAFSGSTLFAKRVRLRTDSFSMTPRNATQV